MDYDEFKILPATIVDTRKYSDEVEFLVEELKEMAHMAGRYDRSVQLQKALYILRTLDEMRK